MHKNLQPNAHPKNYEKIIFIIKRDKSICLKYLDELYEDFV